MSQQSWQAARTKSSEPVTVTGRGMLVPHEGLQVRSAERVICVSVSDNLI